jgi:hypothetical protein
MTNFLPYAIVAGIVIVFFAVCYILYSGNGSRSTKKSETQQSGHKSPIKPMSHQQQVSAHHTAVRHQQPVKEDTAPLPHITTVTVRERKEHPDETAFVTTKGEAVRRDGRIVYKESSQQGHSGKKEDLDATRVLTRDEILAAMDKIDKEEAAAYEARSEEARKERQHQKDESRREDNERLDLDRKLRAQNEKAKTQHKKDQARFQEKERWADQISETEEQEPSLADMAAVVSADLNAKQGQDGSQPAHPAKRHILNEVMKETARSRKQSVATAADDIQPDQPASAPAGDETVRFDAPPAAPQKQSAGVPEETMIVRPVSPAAPKTQAAESSVPKREKQAAAPVSDETQIINPVHAPKKETIAAAVAATLGQTRRLDSAPIARAVSAAKQAQSAPKSAAAPAIKETSHLSPWGNDISSAKTKGEAIASHAHHASIWEEASADSPIIKQCVTHFLSQYGIVTPEMQQQAEYITAAAFQQIGCANDSDRQKALAPLIVQESLQNVQKAYAAHPEKYAASIALRAFHDIVCCSAVSTRHLVAIDALKVMPYLSTYHFKILSVLLLFLYSRNAHNVDKETICQYIDKYVLPFLDGFPTERPYYQQLDYLHCTAFEGKETHFAEILSDSYPLIFRYRGFTEEELRKALQGRRMPSEFIVQSFNSPLYKLAIVDESMATRLFRMTGISDRTVQDHLLRLAKKRPTSFRGEEALDIMEDISPILADLGDIWDSSMLRVSTLSLLGLYLAQGYIKERIGEEFDLSRWFD